LLAGYVPRSSFPGDTGHPALTYNSGESFLVASNDRIGAYTSRFNQWIELDINGNVLGRYTLSLPNDRGPDCSPLVGEIVMTLGDAVFASILRCAKEVLYELDRDNSRWVPVKDWNASGFKALVGVDGTQLVFRKSSPNLEQFGWFSVRSAFSR
jgi:hypothetical protein